jgi:hypothetical protein
MSKVHMEAGRKPPQQQPPKRIGELLEFAADISNRRQCLICGKYFPISTVTIVREHTIVICYLCVGQMKKAADKALDEKGRELLGEQEESSRKWKP